MRLNIAKLATQTLLPAILASLCATAKADPFEIAKPKFGPAAGSSQNLKTAASATQFLAVWTDSRQSPSLRVWATRVSPDGRALDGAGFPLTKPTTPYSNDNLPLATASDGSDFVVVSRSVPLVTSAVITRDGQCVVNDLPLPNTYRATLLWLGSEYAFIYVPANGGSIRYVLLDRGGVPIGSPRDLITTAAGVNSIAAAIGTGPAFVVAWVDSSDDRVHVVRVLVEDARRGSSLPLRAAYGLPKAVPAATEVAIASDGIGYFCVWRENGVAPKYEWAIQGRSLSADGLAAGDEIPLGTTSTYSSAAVAFDGTGFIATFADPNAGVVATAIRAGVAGAPVAQPVTVVSYAPAAPVACSQSGCVLFWQNTVGQVMAAPFPLSVVGPANPGQVVSLGNSRMSSLMGQWRRDHYLVVWSDRDGATYCRFDANGASLDGGGKTISGIRSRWTIATDGDASLIAWSDVAMKSALITHDGLTTTPVVIGTANYAPLVTWDGKEYVAVSAEQRTGGVDDVFRRIRSDGSLADTTRVPRSPERASDFNFLLPINAGYYAYVETRAYMCFPICYTPTDVWLGFLDANFNQVGSAARVSNDAWTSSVGNPAVAKRGSNYLVVWPEQSWPDWVARLHGLRIAGQGLVVDEQDGFVIGEGEYVSGAFSSEEGFTVVSGSSAWSVSPDSRRVTPITAFSFVPPNTNTSVKVAPAPLSLVIAGGPRPLVIYEHEPDAEHDVAYYVGVFTAQPRLRAIRR